MRTLLLTINQYLGCSSVSTFDSIVFVFVDSLYLYCCSARLIGLVANDSLHLNCSPARLILFVTVDSLSVRGM